MPPWCCYLCCQRVLLDSIHFQMSLTSLLSRSFSSRCSSSTNVVQLRSDFNSFVDRGRTVYLLIHVYGANALRDPWFSDLTGSAPPTNIVPPPENSTERIARVGKELPEDGIRKMHLLRCISGCSVPDLFFCFLHFHCCAVLLHSQTPLKKLCRPEDRLIDNKKAQMFGTQGYHHRWLRFVLSYESPTPSTLPPPLPPPPPKTTTTAAMAATAVATAVATTVEPFVPRHPSLSPLRASTKLCVKVLVLWPHWKDMCCLNRRHCWKYGM